MVLRCRNPNNCYHKPTQEEIMSDISRRKFLQTTSASALLFFSGLNKGQAAQPKGYPSKKIGNIKNLKANEPLAFNYPDNNSPCVLIQVDNEAIGGVGPSKNIVSFSTICTHMGCPLTYSNGRLVCKCHYSMFDVSRNGQTYQGLASQWVAQIVLRLDAATGNIYAEGVEGLIYGRIGNLKLS
jgi:arsenite oxidase small subunit